MAVKFKVSSSDLDSLNKEEQKAYGSGFRSVWDAKKQNIEEARASGEQALGAFRDSKLSVLKPQKPTMKSLRDPNGFTFGIGNAIKTGSPIVKNNQPTGSQQQWAKDYTNYKLPEAAAKGLGISTEMEPMQFAEYIASKHPEYKSTYATAFGKAMTENGGDVTAAVKTVQDSFKGLIDASRTEGQYANLQYQAGADIVRALGSIDTYNALTDDEKMELLDAYDQAGLITFSGDQQPDLVQVLKDKYAEIAARKETGSPTGGFTFANAPSEEEPFQLDVEGTAAKKAREENVAQYGGKLDEYGRPTIGGEAYRALEAERDDLVRKRDMTEDDATYIQLNDRILEIQHELDTWGVEEKKAWDAAAAENKWDSQLQKQIQEARDAGDIERVAQLVSQLDEGRDALARANTEQALAAAGGAIENTLKAGYEGILRTADSVGGAVQLTNERADWLSNWAAAIANSYSGVHTTPEEVKAVNAAAIASERKELQDLVNGISEQRGNKRKEIADHMVNIAKSYWTEQGWDLYGSASEKQIRDTVEFVCSEFFEATGMQIGRQLPSLVVSAITGGAGSGISLLSKPAYWMTFASEYCSELTERYDEAKAGGKELTDTDVFLLAASSAVNAYIEHSGGGDEAYRDGLTTIVKSIIGEEMEEGLQEKNGYLWEVIGDVVQGRDSDVALFSNVKDQKAMINLEAGWERIWKTALTTFGMDIAHAGTVGIVQKIARGEKISQSEREQLKAATDEMTGQDAYNQFESALNGDDNINDKTIDENGGTEEMLPELPEETAAEQEAEIDDATGEPGPALPYEMTSAGLDRLGNIAKKPERTNDGTGTRSDISPEVAAEALQRLQGMANPALATQPERTNDGTNNPNTFPPDVVEDALARLRGFPTTPITQRAEPTNEGTNNPNNIPDTAVETTEETTPRANPALATPPERINDGTSNPVTIAEDDNTNDLGDAAKDYGISTPNEQRANPDRATRPERINDFANDQQDIAVEPEDVALKAKNAGPNPALAKKPERTNDGTDNVQTIPDQAVESPDQAANAAVAKQYGFKAGKTQGDGSADTGVHLNGVGKNLSKARLQELSIIDKVAKKFGFSVEVVAGIEHDANGVYRGGRTVYISERTQNAFETVAGHEMWHMVKRLNPEGAAQVESIFDDWTRRTGFDLDGAIQERIALYAEYNESLSPDKAREEVIANTFYRFFSDEETMKQVYAADRTLFERVMDFVKKVRQTISEMLGQYEENTPEAKMLAEQDGALEQMYGTMRSVLQGMRDVDTVKKAATRATGIGDMTIGYQNAVGAAANIGTMTEASIDLAKNLLKKTGNAVNAKNIASMVKAAQTVSSGAALPYNALKNKGLATDGLDAEVRRAMQNLGGFASSVNEYEYNSLLSGERVPTAAEQALRDQAAAAARQVQYKNLTKAQKDAAHPDAAQFSIQQMGESLRLNVVYDTIGQPYQLQDQRGNIVTEFSPDMVKDTPMGTMIRAAVKTKNIDEKTAQAQMKMIADLATLAAQYKDQAMVWEVAGNMMYSSIKNNSDKQYGTTVDYGTICTKTQAVVDVLSETMVRKGRGLTRAEVMDVYRNTAKTGLSVPCPVCYVFSRWMGVPGLLGSMVEYQDRFGSMSEQQVKDWVRDIESRYPPVTDDKGKTISTASQIAGRKAKLDAQIEKMRAKHTAAVAKNDTKAQQALLEEMEAIEKEYKDVEAYNWVTQVLCEQKNKKPKRVKNAQDIEEVVIDKNFTPVRKEILLDLRRTGEFAGDPRYAKSWLYRCTRGAGMGKGILPYSGASIGDTVYHAAAASGKKQRTPKSNAFLNMDDKAAASAINKAMQRMKAQNLIGGHRFQSTSDYRPEWGLDYMMTFMEMQAIGAKGQLYTKVIEAVDMFATAGIECNLSIMGKGDGYSVVNGEKVLKNDDFSSVTGIDFEKALEKVRKYDNVQMILVGLNDDHIRLALKDDRITMVIPWHSSGSSEKTLGALMESVGETLHNGTDYSKTQNDVNDPDATDAQKEARRVRAAILTGKYSGGVSTADRAVIEGNKYLKDLYNKFYVDKSATDTYGVKLSARQAEQIFPHEYWNTSLDYAHADENGRRFVEYCQSLGIIPRFQQFANDPGYWKLLIDRKMYNNDGSYHVPKAISATSVQISDIAGSVEKVNYGDPQKTEAAVQATLDDLMAMEQQRVGYNEDLDDDGLAGQDAGKDVVQYSLPEDQEETVEEFTGSSYSLPVSDKKTLDFLNEQEAENNVTHVYRTMKVLDGKIVSPKATFINGKVEGDTKLDQWESATEHPELVQFDEKNGEPYFVLDEKGRKTRARYNPYIHTSNLMINDQFAGAYAYSGDDPKMGQFVVVEGIVPNSEIDSGYHAQYAKDPVGWTNWKSGGVAQKIQKQGGEARRVFLSRWFKPLRIVPDTEVAQHYKELIGDRDIEIPANVVTQGLLKELQKVGVKIAPPAKQNAAKYEEYVREHGGQDAYTYSLPRKPADVKARNKIKDTRDKLRRMLERPDDNHFVPRQYVQDALDFVDAAMDADNTKRARGGLRWMRAVRQMRADTSTYTTAHAFDDDFVDVMQEAADLLEKKTINELDSEELQFVANVMTQMHHQIRHAASMFKREKNVDAIMEAKSGIETINKQKPYANGGLAKLAHNLVTDHLSPERELDKLAGYSNDNAIYRIKEEMIEGQREANKAKMDMTLPFEKLMTGKNKKNFERFSGKKAEIIDTGITGSKYGTFKFTQDFRAALYLHSLSDENVRGMKNGLTIPDIELWQKGKYQEAWNRGERIYLSKADMDRILAGVTDYEKAWAAAWQEMQAYVTPKLNDVSMVLNGWHKFTVPNYFPIRRDSNYLATDFESLTMDARLANAGFTKARKNASNPMMFEPLTTVVNRTINGSSQYIGLAIPVQNWNKMFNATMPGYTDSMKAALRRVYGEKEYEYIERLLTDLQTNGRKTDSSMFDKLRGKAAGAALGANATVVVKQAASYPTAAAVLGYRPLIRALTSTRKFDENIVRKYTSAYWERTAQNIQAMNANVQAGTIDKSSSFLSAAITGMDRATVRKIWIACEYAVEEQSPSLKHGTDEYNEAVARLYEQCLERTQPEYGVMQRPHILRSNNQLTKTVTMYKTQAIQNFNILYDAVADYAAQKKRYKADQSAKNKAELDRARVKLGRAVSSQLISAAVLAVMTAMGKALLHKPEPYQDEKGELTPESVTYQLSKDAISSMAGMMVGGSEIFDLIVGISEGKAPFDIESSSISMVNDVYQSIYKLGNTATIIADSSLPADKKLEKALKAIDNFFKSSASMVGIPYGNLRNIGNSIAKYYNDFSSGKGFSGLTTSDVSLTTGARYMGEALQDGDEETYARLYNRLLSQGKTQKQINSALRTWMKTGDERIRQAADAIDSGDLDTYNRLINEMTADGMGMANVVTAIESVRKADNAAAEAPEETPAAPVEPMTYDQIMASQEEDSESAYTYAQLNQLLESGNIQAAKKVQSALFKTKKTTNVKSALTSYWKPKYQAAYQARNRTELSRITKLMKAMGYSDSSLNKWKTVDSTGGNKNSKKKNTSRFGGSRFGGSGFGR